MLLLPSLPLLHLPLPLSFSISLYLLPSVTLFAALAGNCQANWLHQLRLRLSLSKPDLSVISMTWSPAAGESSLPPSTPSPVPSCTHCVVSWQLAAVVPCLRSGELASAAPAQCSDNYGAQLTHCWRREETGQESERGVGLVKGGGRECDCLWHAACHKFSGKCNWIYCNWNWD